MRNRFIKTILLFVMISIVPMLNGFCVFQSYSSLYSDMNIAQAANVDSNNTSDSKSCDENIQTENIPVQIPATTTSINHGGADSIFLCCIDGSHPGVSSAIQYTETLPSALNVLLPEEHPILRQLQIAFIDNPILSPPSLSIIETTVLRF